MARVKVGKPMRLIHYLALGGILLSWTSYKAWGQSPPPVFENSAEELTESGYVKLSWRWGPPQSEPGQFEFELQRSQDSQFETATTLYRGPDFATFLSGLENGNYYFRVRGITANLAKGEGKSEWSAPVLIRVNHHSLSLALILFGIGAVLFLLTVAIVIHGTRKSAQNIS